MSFKLHFSYSHLDFFQVNLGDLSKENGKIFHQAIQQISKRYQGRWHSAIMGDYKWSLIRGDTCHHKTVNFEGLISLKDFVLVFLKLMINIMLF